MKNALTTLAKSVFILLGVTTTALAADRGNKKNQEKIWYFSFRNNNTNKIRPRNETEHESS